MRRRLLKCQCKNTLVVSMESVKGECNVLAHFFIFSVFCVCVDEHKEEKNSVLILNMCVCILGNRGMRAPMSAGVLQLVPVWRRSRVHHCSLSGWRGRSPFWPETCTSIRYTRHTPRRLYVWPYSREPFT